MERGSESNLIIAQTDIAHIRQGLHRAHSSLLSKRTAEGPSESPRTNSRKEKDRAQNLIRHSPDQSPTEDRAFIALARSRLNEAIRMFLIRERFSENPSYKRHGVVPRGNSTMERKEGRGSMGLGGGTLYPGRKHLNFHNPHKTWFATHTFPRYGSAFRHYLT